MEPQFKKEQKVKIVAKVPGLKKYANETGEIIDYGYAKAETIPGMAKGLPEGTHLCIYQVRRDKNGFLVSIPESCLKALKT